MLSRVKVPIDLHIGMEKTGTTSIQRYLQDNRDKLLNQYGILFPRSLGIELSIHLAAACQHSEHLDDLRKIRNLTTTNSVTNYRKALQKKFSDELSSTNKLKRVIISCEHLSSRLKYHDDIHTLKDFLQPFSNDVRIIVYLRQQDKFFISSYSTAVKSGRTTPFHYPTDEKRLELFYYSKFLDRWTNIFGGDSLLIRLFEQHRLKNHDIVDDFCSLIDLPNNLTRQTQHENISFNINTLNFLREFNHLVPRFLNDIPNDTRGNIVDALLQLDLPGAKFKGNNDNELFYSQFHEDNRAVAKKWFGNDPSVPGELFSGPVINSAYTPLQFYDQKQLIELCAHIWQYAQNELIKERKRNPLWLLKRKKYRAAARLIHSTLVMYLKNNK